jgi:hypothetical protein
MITTRAFFTRFGIALAGLLVVVGPAHAQAGIGIRGGISVNPDQAYFGGHVNVGPVVDRLWFRPNVEVGIGDNVTTLALNGEFAYWFGSRRAAWRPYVGAGPALNIFFPEGGGSDSRAGLNFLLGAAHRGGFFVEAKVGAFDSPDFKLGAGFTFH